MKMGKRKHHFLIRFVKDLLIRKIMVILNDILYILIIHDIMSLENNYIALIARLMRYYTNVELISITIHLISFGQV